MLLQEHRMMLMERFNEMRKLPQVPEILEGMDPPEFASSVVLVAVTENKHEVPHKLFYLALDIQNNYEEFVDIVAAVFYDSHFNN